MRRTTIVTLITAFALPCFAFFESEHLLEGNVARFLLAPHGEVDGFLLRDGTTVKTPLHLSEEVQATVRMGDPVEIQLAAEPPAMTSYGRGVEALTLTNLRTGKTLTDSPLTAPPRRPIARFQKPLDPIEVRSPLIQCLFTESGQLNGVLLQDGSEVRFPLSASAKLMGLIERNPHEIVVASGPGLRTEYGNVIDAKTLLYGADGIREITQMRAR